MLIPERLFVNQLRSGEYEFSAHIALPPKDDGAKLKLSWEIQSDDTNWSVRSVTEHIHKGSDSPDFLHLAAILPPDWNLGRLLIETEYARDRQEFSEVIERFDQPVELTLPLAGYALTAVGHNVGEVHRAAVQVPSQQFGWDFLGLGENSLSIVDIQASQLSADHFAGFGAQVISPADGVVIDVKDGAKDLMEIGVLPEDLSYFMEDLTRALGNYVILKHAEDMYTVLAHLKEGSLRVSKGQQVTAGDQIGALGNSGYSSGPHLHFHVMDGPDILTATPLPVVLHLEDGIFDPQGGDIVSNG